MTNLREAAQMALDALEWCYDVTEWPANGNSSQDKAIEALRTALATEQENSRSQKMIDAGFTKRDTLLECDGCGKKFSRLMLPIHDCKDAQREWQGLTDEEYETMAEHYVTNCYFDTLKYARAIEAKLREKNSL